MDNYLVADFVVFFDNSKFFFAIMKLNKKIYRLMSKDKYYSNHIWFKIKNIYNIDNSNFNYVNNLICDIYNKKLIKKLEEINFSKFKTKFDCVTKLCKS